MSAVAPDARFAAASSRTVSRVHPPSDRTAALALIAIVALAAGVRVRLAWLTPLWSDEIFTLWILRDGPPHMLALLRHDMHPPLFFLAVEGWRAIGGEDARWVRLLPLVFGVATVWVTYALTRDLFGRPA